MLLALALLALGGAAQYVPPAPQELWFTQRLDHTDPSDARTFQQRFLIFDDWYTAGGPIYFCPGGEADVYGGYYHNGFMFETGRPKGALLVFPEHRFYGQSLPAGAIHSFDPETIIFLTVEQSLADNVAVLEHVRQAWQVPEATKVIAFGGSYPGELAAFLRFQFPAIFHGALSSSAPLRYHQGIFPAVPNGAFFGVVTDKFAALDPTCPSLVRSSITEINDLCATPAGCAQAAARLSLCAIPSSVRLLMLWLESGFASLAMENYPYAVDPFVAAPLNASCAALRENFTEQNRLEKLAAAINVAYNVSSAPVTCFNITDEYYPCSDITGCGGGVGDPDALSWDYQSCTELLSPVDTNGKTDMFPPAPYNFSQVAAYCFDRWGATPDPMGLPTRFNISASSATNIIFSNGLLDPWTPGGVTTNLSDTLVVFLIEGAAHHLDLRGSAPEDPPAVTAARAAEDAIISHWLQL